MKKYHVAVVGATGAVGSEFLRVLERRSFPVASLRAMTSARSAGKRVQFRNESIAVEELTTRSFDQIDIALFSAGAESPRNFRRPGAVAGPSVMANPWPFALKP